MLLLAAPACGSSKKVEAPAAVVAPDAGAADGQVPPESDAESDPGDDRDGDGVPDGVDQCPDQAMAMSGGCTKEMMHGCPDDCRPPSIVVP